MTFRQFLYHEKSRPGSESSFARTKKADPEKGGISRRGGVCECPKDRSHGVTRVLRSRFRHIPPWGMSRSDRGSESPFARTKKADPERGRHQPPWRSVRVSGGQEPRSHPLAAKRKAAYAPELGLREAVGEESTKGAGISGSFCAGEGTRTLTPYGTRS